MCASCAILKLIQLTASIVPIPLPLPHIKTVNAWLLRGNPLTLLDTGPRDERALAELERGLARAGVRVEDLELVLATHHHLDHVGLAAAIKRRSGARVAALGAVAAYAERYHDGVAADRDFSRRLLERHGVPPQAIDDNEAFWDFVRANTEDFTTDVRLAEGDRIRAGGRELEVVARPGHSATDTLFVDRRARLAFVGDHLLAGISSNTELSPAEGPEPRSRLRYLRNLRRTAVLPVDRLLTGHGRPVTSAAALVRLREAEHRKRAARIARVLLGGPETAYGIAGHLWSERTVREQPLLVVWEVLGHLELLDAAGLVRELHCSDGRRRFRLGTTERPDVTAAG
jgi:glyoxylase-like metal-dependent hydrolase (beta-lactamase superfamily II)